MPTLFQISYLLFVSVVGYAIPKLINHMKTTNDRANANFNEIERAMNTMNNRIKILEAKNNINTTN